MTSDGGAGGAEGGSEAGLILADVTARGGCCIKKSKRQNTVRCHSQANAEQAGIRVWAIEVWIWNWTQAETTPDWLKALSKLGATDLYRFKPGSVCTLEVLAMHMVAACSKRQHMLTKEAAGAMPNVG